MEPYEIVELFEVLWSRHPKNVPIIAKEGSGIVYALLVPVEDLQLYAALSVGVRGGINETIYVFDHSQVVVADKLLVSCFDGGGVGQGAIFPLVELRRQVMQASSKRRLLALKLCLEAMWDLADRRLTAQELRRIPSTSQSFRRVVQGGIPSQGRHGGGVFGGR